MSTPIPDGKILVQFDGMCILCSKTIKFLLKADRRKKFVFQTLQNSSSNKSFDTVIVVDRGISYQFFDAALKIGKELGGIYRIIGIFRILPAKWRHRLYLWIARNRFSWFGKRTTCYFPTPEEKSRFI